MKLIQILICLSFLSCSTYVFRLHDGEVVYCKDVVLNECVSGLSLYRCDNGKQYLCQQNVSEIADDRWRKEAIERHEVEKKSEEHIIELDPFYIYPRKDAI